MFGIPYLVLFIPNLLLVPAILFNGTCPEVLPNNETRINSSGLVMATVLYSTTIESEINHVFYNSYPNLQYLTLHMIPDKFSWMVAKLNQYPHGCKTVDYLVPSDKNGYYKHEVRKYVGFGVNALKENCGSYWDRYQLLQGKSIVIIWGCVNLESQRREEGLWVLQLKDDLDIKENEKKAMQETVDMFPVGSINYDHLEKVHHIDLEHKETLEYNLNCTQLLCKKDFKLTYTSTYGSIVVGVIVIMFALSCLVLHFSSKMESNRVGNFII